LTARKQFFPPLFVFESIATYHTCLQICKYSEGPNCMSSFITDENNWFNQTRAEILAPNACIHERGKNIYFEYTKAAAVPEAAVIIIIAVTFVMLLLIAIAWRSRNPYQTDWFRIVGIYAAATLLFVFILRLGPITPGFSSLDIAITLFYFFWEKKWFVGFAVVIHNFAELYLLRVVWFGKKANALVGNVVIVLYVFIMTTSLAFLPMNGLYILAMVQGATMDYLLCITFPVVAFKFRAFRHNRSDFILAAVAAFIHIGSIQPLFVGFALANNRITQITALGLFPTFFLYTYFAGRELGRLSLLGPSFQEILVHFFFF
ncbi:hypothetical protein RFI_39402, partial [Reticulomyxa filosa]